MSNSSWRSGDGNIALVLLVAIVLGGIIVVLFGQTRQTIATAQRDRDFNQAIQIADAGAHAAYTYLASQHPDDIPVEVGEVITSTGEGVNGELGEGVYEWRALRVGPRSYEIRAEGGFQGSVRAMEMEMGPFQLFPMAIWGGQGLDGNYPANNPHGPSWLGSDFDGGTGAYDDDGLIEDGEVVAGTSNRCSINPSPDDLDQVLYTTDTDSDNLEGCDSRSGFVPEFPDLAEEAFSPGGKCAESGLAAGGSYPEYPGSAANTDITLVPGQLYCFENMLWGTAHRLRIADVADAPSGSDVFLGADLDTDGETVDYVEVYVRGSVEATGQNGVPARRRINVDDGELPNASQLRIFMEGSGTAFAGSGNNHAWIAAAVYAPKRTCEVRTQTTFFGTLICNDFDIGGGGGFNFWYDVRTADIFSDTEISIRTVREELMNTTGFDWFATS